ncbi:MAG: DegT/DnrJ/EryC1/StrS family aminotransferase [Alphaproteobacteria bacterium]|nr:DegT/DnrJ/EryC1/StrS family aminotransferase [Alphaproteobacteria bacterium]
MMRSSAGLDIPYVNLKAQYAEEKDEIHAAVERVFSKGDFILGEAVAEFERQLSRRFGFDYVVALNSGTDALMLALLALGVGQGDEVITQSNSFVASAATIVQVGARPVFVDVKPDQCMDPAKIEAAITAKTKAIMPVHLTGRICDMPAIQEIADRHKLFIVEDAAQSIGSTLLDRQAGNWGDAGAFSLHPLKNLNAAGDAGFLTTKHADVAERIRRLRNHGQTDRNTVTEWGINSRLDTLQATLLLMRLERLPNIIARRRANVEAYRRLLNAKHVFSPPCRQEEFNTFHTFVVQVDRRDELREHLHASGVGSAIHYPIPIHLQPAAAKLGSKPGDLPVTEKQAGRIISLPIHQFLTDGDIRRVADTVNGFFK